MNFGLLLTAVHGAGVDPQRQLDEHFQLARRAEELGFDLLMAGQHFLSSELRFYQPVPYLANLSARHPQMRVGTGIMLLPLLNPVDVAEQIATLDVLSGGRAVWGVGLGYADPEFRAFGVDRKRRASRFEESIEVIGKIWEGGAVEHSGEHFEFDLPPSTVLPIQRPRPPIWVAGQVAAAVRRAARCGDAWYVPPLLGHGEVKALAAIYDEERERVGRTEERVFPLRREVFIAPTVEAALDQMRPHVSRRQRTYVDLGINKVLAADTTFGRDDDEGLLDRFVVGPPDHCAEQLARLRDDLGVTDFVLRAQWPGLPFEQALEQLTLFGEQVMPQLRAAG